LCSEGSLPVQAILRWAVALKRPSRDIALCGFGAIFDRFVG
jgi:hypothetical protein